MSELANLLEDFLTSCELLDTRVKLEFDTGRFVSGKFIDPADITNIDPKNVEQGPQGWKIKVGGTCYQAPEGGEMLFTRLEDAIYAGYELLYLPDGVAEDDN